MQRYDRLCSEGCSGLDVVATQVLLQVQDGQLITLLQAEELAERSIGVDALLVHELVLLAVGGDGLGHVGAADGVALGLAEEGQELIRDCDGSGEDAGLGHGTLDRGLAVLALAISLLGEAGRQLLDRLEVGGGLRVQGLELGVDLLLAGDGLVENRAEVLVGSGLHSGRGGLGNGDGDRDDNSGCSCGSGCGLLAGLSSSGGSGNRRRSGNHRGGHRLNNLRRLLGGLRGRCGSAHFDNVGGSI